MGEKGRGGGGIKRFRGERKKRGNCDLGVAAEGAILATGRGVPSRADDSYWVWEGEEGGEEGREGCRGEKLLDHHGSREVLFY